MHIDLFLAFTECEGMCIFCKRGKNLVEFSRGDYIQDTEKYNFIQLNKPSEIDEAIGGLESSVTHINITGYEPTKYPYLADLSRKIRKKFPDSTLTLRTSGISVIRPEDLGEFDRIELPIYGDSEYLHNHITGSPDGWNILHENLQILKKSPLRDRLYFQTILLKSNLHNASGIVQKALSYSEHHQVKIVYPYFFPKENFSELLSRYEIIEYLLKNIPAEILKSSCILTNFPYLKQLKKYFYAIRL